VTRHERREDSPAWRLASRTRPERDSGEGTTAETSRRIFVLNEPVHLTDPQGARDTLWFREMVGASCVFDYRYAG
jgi:hypothetical protein